jgi:hypothetical protein
MKKAFKIIGGLLVLLFITLFIGIKLMENKKPDIADVKIELKTDSLTLARGEYLAKNVAVCMDCHSDRNFNLFAGPVIESTHGKGGEGFLTDYGFPGNYYADNLTPFHLKSMTDEQFYKAITSGVGSNQFGLFPIMPWPKYGKADKNDILAIMSYIRTLSPIENFVPESQPRFPMTFIRNLMPKDAEHQPIPDTTKLVEYGAYLANLASCSSCHSQQNKGKPLPGLEYAGGFRMAYSGGVNLTSNITPDKETGIGNWSKEQFIKRFKMYNDSNYVAQKVNKGEPQSLMPWTSYAGMTEYDLGAIYEFLMSLEPVKNKVEPFNVK